MNSQNEAIRRVALWAALMTTAVALVGLQFGCDRPATTLSAPGFPHASRQNRPDETIVLAATPAGGMSSLATAPATTQAKLDIHWIEPRSPEKSSAQALPSGGSLALEPGAPDPKPKARPVPTAPMH